MISLHSAPTRLRAAILEYLCALFALFRASADPNASIAMPEFSAADLVRLNAQIRLDDLWAACFLPPRRKSHKLSPQNFHASLAPALTNC